jgi:2-methylisocitrate lyase-like PEP mutase family enzyme
VTEHNQQAALFRSLHTAGQPLVLVNAWDAASARIVEAAGAAAVATTSAGVAWALGAPDGDAVARDLVVDLVRRIVATVSVPVSADIETGYGTTPEDVATTVRAVLDAGAVGVNIEDARRDGDGPLRDVEGQCARIAAARAAAGDSLYINARIDTYLAGAGGADETVARASAYLAAGADGVFVPGLVDPDTIAKLVPAVAAPLNIMAWPGAPSVAELAGLGVARVSVGSGVAQAAYAVARRAAVEMFEKGTYDTLADALDFGELQGLMRG